MKNLLSILICGIIALFSSTISATNIEIVIEEYSPGTNNPMEKITKNNLVIEFLQGSGTEAPTMKGQGYTTFNKGNEIIFTYSKGIIKSLNITYYSSSKTSNCTVSTGTYSESDNLGKWTDINTSSATITSQKSGYITKISAVVEQITYTDTPTLEIIAGNVDDEGLFESPITVRLTPAENTTVAYTLYDINNEIIEEASIQTVKEFELSATTTIEAVASAEGCTDSKISATYIYSPLTVGSIAEFLIYAPHRKTETEGTTVITPNEPFTIDTPLYIIAQKGEFLFVTDKADGSETCLLITLSGNVADDSTYNRGDYLANGVKGYYAEKSGIVPTLLINSYNSENENHSDDSNCSISDPESAGIVTPIKEYTFNEIAEELSTGLENNLHRYISIKCVKFDSETLTISAQPTPQEMQSLENSQTPIETIQLSECLMNLSDKDNEYYSMEGIIVADETTGTLQIAPSYFVIATEIKEIEKHCNISESVEYYDINGIKLESVDAHRGLLIKRMIDGTYQLVYLK